jgi:hypothetical protein
MKQPARNRQRTRQPPAAEASRSPILGGEKLMPLDYLLRLLNDPNASQQRRDRAARTALPYLHRRADSVPKRAQREADAKRAGGKGTGWGGDLDPDGHRRQ